MKSGKATMVVGHEHWGKSTTLRALTGTRSVTRGPETMIIKGHKVRIKRMSNDDPKDKDPQHFWRFICGLDPESDPYVIIAFCPNFESDAKTRRNKLDAGSILDKLASSYQLSFWVIKESQNPQEKLPREISAKEIKALRGYGRVETFSGKATEKERAE